MNNIFKNLEEYKIKGLGPKSKELLKSLGIESLFELLYAFPKSYDDRSSVREIDSLIVGETTTIFGKVLKTALMTTRTRKRIFKAYISDDSDVIEVTWFQMPYLKNIITKGKDVYIHGKVGEGRKMVNPEYAFTKREEVLPIYNLTKGLGQSVKRNIVKSALAYSNLFNEIIPKDIVDKYSIMSREESLKEIHFPTSNQNLERAKRRFAIEELLIFQFAILSKRFENGYNNKGRYSLEDNRDLVKRYVSSLPYNLTSAQKRVIKEIYEEFKEGKNINRLLQGDVGSGKTVVLFILILYIISNGYQAVLMAPTEVLAEQHYLNIKEQFRNLGIYTALLTSSQKGSEKRFIQDATANGSINLVIGTHALIYDKVVFKKLGLVVIDEQHKFGVDQRKRLIEKGSLNNVITTSATPIPRSLALTIYGDLDISVIDEMPKSRKPVLTKVVNSLNIESVYRDIKTLLDRGEQAYFVAPLVEDSDKIDAHSVENLYLKLKDHFKDYKLGLLHGRLDSQEKERVISEFKNRETNILLATTVIEVGVDVANATAMVIFNAERFGLSQLHQLRGRVGRGSLKSYCYLISAKAEDNVRLNILEKTSDGFKISEEDLKIRNAGDLLGVKQSGVTDSSLVDLLRDVKAIKLAREEAIKYLEKNGGKIPELIKEELQERFYKKSVMN